MLSCSPRLHTVAFYDRVLVLDKGEVSEYDTPLALLENPDSVFRSMCEKVSRVFCVFVFVFVSRTPPPLSAVQMFCLLTTDGVSTCVCALCSPLVDGIPLGCGGRTVFLHNHARRGASHV